MNEEDLNTISSACTLLGLPPEIDRSYRSMGVQRMYHWQGECLHTTGVINGNNLVYCAPTSGGKTLVAELLILRTVLVQRRKAIFVLPFVSLVTEKERYFKRLLTLVNRSLPGKDRIKVRGFYGDQSGSRSYKENILICTVEKANGIFNTLVMRGKGALLGCVILDEMHILGNTFNGYLLEILISKIKFAVDTMQRRQAEAAATNAAMEAEGPARLVQGLNVHQTHLQTGIMAAPAALRVSSRSDPRSVSSAGQLVQAIQLIALSATMGNVEELAAWVGGAIYRTSFRPVPLIERIKAGNELLDPAGCTLAALPAPAVGRAAGVETDSDHLALLCGDALRKGQQVLIFCPSKFICLQTCRLLAGAFTAAAMSAATLAGGSTQAPLMTHLDVSVAVASTGMDEGTRERLIAARNALAEQLLQENPGNAEGLCALVMQGVAYHNAGLSAVERSLVERGFRAGHISVLAATSTLAAGVNLPAGRVLVRSMQIGAEALGVMQYKQMCGRAGRAGQDGNVGESFLLVKASEKAKALQLCNQPMPCVLSQMHPSRDGGNALLKAVLEVVSLGICGCSQEAISYVQQTLLYRQALRGEGGDSGESILATARSIVSFLVNIRAIDAEGNAASAANENAQPAETVNGHGELKLNITRFGKAIMQSNVNPDEAIVMYDSLLRAQDGLHLETALHILYLVTPLEHRIVPNFRRLLGLYESSKSSTTGGGRQLAAIFDAVGVDYGTLCRWQANPPSKGMVDVCSSAVRVSGLHSASAREGTAVASTAKAYKNVRREEWQVLSRCKRLWAAMILQCVLDGRPMAAVAKEFDLADASEIEALLSGAQIMVSKVVRFCEQVGWTAMQRMLRDFQQVLQLGRGDTKELTALLEVPHMPRKVAAVLAASVGYATVQAFVAASASAVAQLLQLSIGFELQELDEIEVRLEEGVLSESRNDSTAEALVAGQNTAPTARPLPMMSRDEVTRQRLLSVVESLQTAARELLLKKAASAEGAATGALAAATADKEGLPRLDKHTGYGQGGNINYGHDEPPQDESDDANSLGDSDVDSLLSEQDLRGGDEMEISEGAAALPLPVTSSQQRDEAFDGDDAAWMDAEEEAAAMEATLAAGSDAFEGMPAVGDEMEVQFKPGEQILESLTGHKRLLVQGSQEVISQSSSVCMQGRTVAFKAARHGEGLADQGIAIYPAVGKYQPAPNLPPSLLRPGPQQPHATPIFRPHTPSSLSVRSVGSGMTRSARRRGSLTMHRVIFSPLCIPILASQSHVGSPTGHASDGMDASPAPQASLPEPRWQPAQCEYLLTDEEVVALMEELESRGLLERAPQAMEAAEDAEKGRQTALQEQIGEYHFYNLHQDDESWESESVYDLTNQVGRETRSPNFSPAPVAASAESSAAKVQFNSALKKLGASAFKVTIQPLEGSSRRGRDSGVGVGEGYGAGEDQTGELEFERQVQRMMEDLERRGIIPVAAVAAEADTEAAPISPVLQQSAPAAQEPFASTCAGAGVAGGLPYQWGNSSFDFYNTGTASDDDGGEHSRDTVVSCSDLLKAPFEAAMHVSAGPSSPRSASAAVVNIARQTPTAEEVTAVVPSTSVRRSSNKDRNRLTPRGISPYATPFTPSKVCTPGRYLYYPLWHSLALSQPHASYSQGSAVRSGDIKSATYCSDVLPPSSLASASELGFGMRHLRKESSCAAFVALLRTAKCVAVELVFRPLPSAWLRRYRPSPSRREEVAQQPPTAHPRVHSWTPYLSSACHPSRSVTCSPSDHTLGTTLSLNTEDCATAYKRPGHSRGLYVLVGAALCFGDSYGYYLPLPTPLPLPQSPFRPVDGSEAEPATGIDRLSLTCRVLIASFVGFGSHLTKCPALADCMLAAQSSRAVQATGNGPSPYSVERDTCNPLLLASRRWSYAARQALLLAWRKGACTEWRLLGDLMQNREITKAGLHIKSQLVALRERDVVVEGPLEDPAVAQTLLRQCGGVDGKQSPLSVAIPQLSSFRSDPLKTGQKIACFRAVAVFRAASQVSARLSAVSLLPLYRNIEMALLYCATDAEHCGIALDAGHFSKLRQDLTLRLQLIEQYFASLFGEDFNLASPVHVAQLKRGLLEECRRAAEAACQGSMPAAEQLQVSAAVLDRHPVVRLVSEHRAHVRLLPLCTSVLASRRLDRVRSHYNTLGTETGRVIITQPPLQQMPKQSNLVSCTKASLHEELCSFEDPNARRSFVTHLNNKSETVLTGQTQRSGGVWVRVVSLAKSAALRQGALGLNVAAAGDSPSVDYSTGRLVRVLDASILQPPCGPISSDSSAAPIDRPVVQQWREVGFPYSDAAAAQICQVLVEFPPGRYLAAGDAGLLPLPQYVYPADKVFRTDAPVLPIPAEVDIINHSLAEGWAETLLLGDKEGAMTVAEDNIHTTVNVRDGFVAGAGYVLLAADYSQVELRILAHFSAEPHLTAAFQSGQDVFRAVAARWLGKEEVDVKDSERTQVKQICYALIYGAGPSLVAQQAGVTAETAQGMMRDFLRRYPGVLRFLQSTKKQCRREGYVQTLLGRRRYLPDIRSEDKGLRARAERQAVNTLCQGSAADLIKLAMINIHTRLTALSQSSPSTFSFRRQRSHPGAGLYRTMDDVRPVLQVHDELLFEVRPQDLQAVGAVVKECMEGAVVLNVPLQVKLSCGSSWGSLAPLVLESSPPRPSQPSQPSQSGSQIDPPGGGRGGAVVRVGAVNMPPVQVGHSSKSGVTAGPPVARDLFGKD